MKLDVKELWGKADKASGRGNRDHDSGSFGSEAQ